MLGAADDVVVVVVAGGDEEWLVEAFDVVRPELEPLLKCEQLEAERSSSV